MADLECMIGNVAEECFLASIEIFPVFANDAEFLLSWFVLAVSCVMVEMSFFFIFRSVSQYAPSNSDPSD